MRGPSRPYFVVAVILLLVAAGQSQFVQGGAATFCQAKTGPHTTCRASSEQIEVKQCPNGHNICLKHTKKEWNAQRTAQNHYCPICGGWINMISRWRGEL